MTMSLSPDRLICLSLIIPCYNEDASLRTCVESCLKLRSESLALELIIVDDCSRDKSREIAAELATEHPEVKLLCHEVNQGKGAALRTGFTHATGDFVGIQDADSEYDPQEYLKLIEPLRDGEADAVYGSRFLKRESHRVLKFYHSFMNRGLTFLSNLFTDLDITDMETCYKLFTREAIQSIAPELKENRFGFEPEVTELVARHRLRLYEMAIDYHPRSYEEGKKIGWKDGFRALYCILHYGAPYAPLPMQLFIYFLIGLTCAIANIALFSTGMVAGLSLTTSTICAFVLAAALNYLLCISILFRHKARWNSTGELAMYLLTISFMGLFDWGITAGLAFLGTTALFAKTVATALGFIGNFLLRKFLVF